MAFPASFIDELKLYVSSFFEQKTALSMVGLTASMCILPVIMFVISLFVIRKKYIIDEEFYEKISNEIRLKEVKE